jgi:lincosamide nucleotidyltransferase A/C/D/E
MAGRVSLTANHENGSFDSLRSTLQRLHLLRLARFVHSRYRLAIRLGIHSLMKMARLPVVGPPIDTLLEKIDKRERIQFEADELVRVCSALEDAGLQFWIAGGWGLDLLVGCQTRQHSDLDVVLDDFWRTLDDFDLIITPLGYERLAPLSGTIWFPDVIVYEDTRGHHIEVTSIHWRNVSRAAEPSESDRDQYEDSPHAPAALLAQCTATGVIDGLDVPIVSLYAQKMFHGGYPPRPEDRQAADVFRLLREHESDESDGEASDRGSRAQTGAALTLLLVPIFTFPAGLWRLCRLYDNRLDLIPPHVTLAFPFLPLGDVTSGVIENLSEFFSNTDSFDFSLERVRWFDHRVIYLEPTGSERFSSIVEDLREAYPTFLPYNGEFSSVIPHVTLSDHGTVADRRLLGKQAPRYLPFSARATHVWMMSNWSDPNVWTLEKIFALGNSAQLGR